MKNPIRVLQIIGSMNVGGAETMIMNIYRKIDRTRIQFDFFVSIDKECFYDNEIRQLGGNIYHTVTKSTQPLKYSIDLWKLIKQNRYVIVHVHTSNAMASIPIIIAKMAGVRKRIVHSHTSDAENNKKLHNIIRPILNITATDKFSCSDLASEWMYGKKKDRVVVINNPIDCQLFRFDNSLRKEMRGSLGLRDEITYVHVGNFSKQKNYAYLIDIFSEIHRRNSNSVLLLVGSGELQPEVEMKVYKQNLQEAVYFLGIRSDVYNVLQACDGFLFPSLYEGLPLTLIEAQAAGLRCYVSDVITAQVAVTNLIKMISLTKSPKEWANIILNDIGRPVDKEQCNKLIYNLFDSNFVANQFISKYYKI